MKPLLPVDEAVTRLLDAAVPVVDSETLPLAECDGRVLAADLAARLTNRLSMPRPWTAMRCAVPMRHKSGQSSPS